jgi:hypothetical protein
MQIRKANNQEELNIILSSGIKYHLDLRGWTTRNINLEGANTGDINLQGADTLDINLQGANTGDINLQGADTGDIWLEEANTGDINLQGATTLDIKLHGANTGSINPIAPITEDTKRFLRSIPFDVFDMDEWYSNDNWKKCKTIDELHTCGTTYCIRGYAEAEYYVKHGQEILDKNSLYTELKHLFFMTDEQAKNEIHKILNN